MLKTVAEALKMVVSPNIGSVLEASIHAKFTAIADALFGAGYLDRKERIQLSKAIGESLECLNAVITELQLDQRELNEYYGAELYTKMSPPDTLAFGTGLKALGDGVVRGCAVVFSPDGRKDLTGEYFQGDTDFMWAGQERRPAMFHHGLDKKLGPRTLGEQGWELDEIDDVGVWVTHQLDLRDQYEAALYGLVVKGKMGLSSGTAQHMVLREDDGKISRWPITEISYTALPAEPRTAVMAMKSWQPVTFDELTQAETKRPPERAESAPTGPSKAQQSRGKSLRSQALRQLLLKTSGGKTMSLLNAIGALVSDLTEEQLKQIEAVISLNGGADRAPSENGGASDAADDTVKAMIAAALEEMAQSTEKLEEKSNDGVALKAAITEALKEMGIVPREEQERDRTPVDGRPPYEGKSFSGMEKPDTSEQERDPAVKAFTQLKYNKVEPAVKAVINELYGSNYADQVVAQKRAYGVYLRYGRPALDAAAHRSLKTIILTPGQIRKKVNDGVFVHEIKTSLSNIIDDLGGYTVPEDDRIGFIERMPAATIIRPRAEVFNTSSDVMRRVKVEGGDSRYTSGVRVTYVGDTPAEDQADTGTSFSVESTPVHIVKATVPVPLSLLEDTAQPLAARINEWVVNAYAQDEDYQLLIGNGIAKPMGILPGGENAQSLEEVASGAAATVTADQLKYQQDKVNQQYQDGCVWIMNSTTKTLISTLKAGDGHYLLRDGLEPGTPNILLGRPVLLSEAMPDVAAGAYPIIYGNPYGVQIADRIGMSVQRDDVTQAEEDIVKYLFRRRYGGQVVREWMFAVMKIAESL